MKPCRSTPGGYTFLIQTFFGKGGDGYESNGEDTIWEPEKILALDGGGIRGILSVEILAKIEEMLREKTGGKKEFVLADYFDFLPEPAPAGS